LLCEPVDLKGRSRDLWRAIGFSSSRSGSGVTALHNERPPVQPMEKGPPKRPLELTCSRRALHPHSL